MKRMFFLLGVVAALAFTVMSCDNGGSLVKDNGGHSGEPNTPQESYSLVGKWYEVGSTDAEGRIVVFTDATVTATYYYRPDDINYVWFNNSKYLIKNDTLIIPTSGGVSGLDPSHPFTTHFMFHSNDTLEIELFIETALAIPYPYNFTSIILYRR